MLVLGEDVGHHDLLQLDALHDLLRRTVRDLRAAGMGLDPSATDAVRAGLAARANGVEYAAGELRATIDGIRDKHATVRRVVDRLFAAAHEPVSDCGNAHGALLCHRAAGHSGLHAHAASGQTWVQA